MKIKNESDFVNADSKLNLRKISSNEIEITDVYDIWDGPLSGSCLWENKDYYFFSFDQLEDDKSGDRWPRKYILVSLDSEQKQTEEELKNLYSALKKGEFTAEEYSNKLERIPKLQIENKQIVGWFDSEDVEKNGTPTRFMQSYFSWKEKN